jgi:hypothetical protein
MKKSLLIYAILFATCSTKLVNAHESQTLYCPEAIKTTQEAAEVDPEWQVTLDKGVGGNALEDVRFYAGHPSQIANLVPDSSQRLGKLRKSTWRFSKTDHSEYWVACSYRKTNLLVTKKLPEKLVSCQLNEQLLPSGSVLKIKDVVCQ